MKKALVLLFALIAVFGAVAQTKFPLRINCNLSDADLYINDKLYTKTTPGLVVNLPPATYSIKVARTGYLEYSARVTVPAGGTTISVTLQPIGAVSTPPSITAPNLLASTPLNVLSNIAGAEVYLSGTFVGTTPLSIKVVPAIYDVVVKAPGYRDFAQNTKIFAATQINATLSPLVIQATLSVTANVQGAEVVINGNPAGRTPFSSQVPQGSSTVTVRAPGYLDFSQNVVVSGPVQVNANLQPLQATLSVSANVQGAEVLINGNPAGRTPFSAQLPQGSYTVLVRAPGYLDFSQNLLLSGPVSVNAVLQPLAASFQVAVPEAYVNKDLKGGHWSQIMIYVDGVLQRGATGGQLLPGRHVIRVTSGGMAVETVVEAQAGRTYVLEPFMGVSVK